VNPVDPLAQLRDIHLPAAVDWWPLAPGWWLLLALLLVGLLAAGYSLRRRWIAGAYRRAARTALVECLAGYQRDGDAGRYLADVNEILKRTALSAYPAETVAGLAGGAWCEFLDSQVAPNDLAFRDSGLASEVYAAKPGLGQPDRLHTAALHWVNRHRATA
jgi:hypothetical protein